MAFRKAEMRNTKTQLLKEVLDCKMKLAADNASTALVQKMSNAQKFGSARVAEAKERKTAPPVLPVFDATAYTFYSADEQSDLQRAIKNSLK